jgi:indole-3-glycerol phosphate synthase
MSILEQICADKRKHVSEQISKKPLSVIESLIEKAPPLRGFKTNLHQLKEDKKIGLIGEIKKASPSSGIIRWDFDPSAIALSYERAGASCLSVLTDAPYFHGQDEYLTDVKSVCSLPILRKDFIIDSYQVYESRAIGADCILIIMAALSDLHVKEIYSVANELDLDAIFEVHDLEELQRAHALGAKIIGVNARNLNTLQVDLQNTLDLIGAIPHDTLKVAESGIKSYADIQKLEKAGYNAALVGESIMKQTDIEAAVKSLMGQT